MLQDHPLDTPCRSHFKPHGHEVDSPATAAATAAAAAATPAGLVAVESRIVVFLLAELLEAVVAAAAAAACTCCGQRFSSASGPPHDAAIWLQHHDTRTLRMLFTHRLLLESDLAAGFVEHP